MLTFLYVVHFIVSKQPGDIRRGGGTRKTDEQDMRGRMVFGNKHEQNRACYIRRGPPFGKVFAVPRAAPRMAPMADMKGREMKRRKHALSPHT